MSEGARAGNPVNALSRHIGRIQKFRDEWFQVISVIFGAVMALEKQGTMDEG